MISTWSSRAFVNLGENSFPATSAMETQSWSTALLATLSPSIMGVGGESFIFGLGLSMLPRNRFPVVSFPGTALSPSPD